MLAKWFFLYCIAALVVAAVIWFVLIAAVTVLGWLAISTVHEHVMLRRRQRLLR